MADREKLIELLDDVQQCGEDHTDYEIYGMRLPNTVSNEVVADHLISHGVTVRERGRWDKNWSGDNIVYCDRCYMPQDMPTPYCHSCGADMRGEEYG